MPSSRQALGPLAMRRRRPARGLAPQVALHAVRCMAVTAVGAPQLYRLHTLFVYNPEIFVLYAIEFSPMRCCGVAWPPDKLRFQTSLKSCQSKQPVSCQSRQGSPRRQR